MSPAERLRIEHMLSISRSALKAIAGKSFHDLHVENEFTLALIKRIEMIGEAASRISPTTRKALSGIPWAAIVNTRHRLIHGYDAIDLSIVWQIATEDLASLIAGLESAIDKS